MHRLLFHSPQNIASSANRLNEPFFAMPLKFAAQMTDINFKYIWPALEIIAPDAIHQYGAGEYNAWIA